MNPPFDGLPRTQAVRRAIAELRSDMAAADLMFLEQWEVEPAPQLGVVLRANQIRRANPALAQEIRAELRQGRPLTAAERASLLAPALHA